MMSTISKKPFNKAIYPIRQNFRTKQQSGGFTLLEVLIAVVILSIGLLGVAGIQLKGLRGTHSSHLRSQATVLANDMAERIRANPAGANSPAGTASNDTYADVDLSNIDCVAAKANPVRQCGATNGVAALTCTTRQMATYDISSWLCGISDTDGVSNLLASADATVTCTDLDAGLAGEDTDNCTPGSTLTLRVSWNETDPTNGDADQTKTVQLFIVP